MSNYRYGNIITLATLQFDGHFQDYFIRNSRKVVALYKLPRRSQNNFLEYYVEGKLVEKKDLISPANIVLSYSVLYFQYLRALFTYFKRDEKVFFISYIPFLFAGGSIIRLFRNVQFVFRIGDYWPMDAPIIQFYRFVTHYLHKHIPLGFYQTDRINTKMNGRIINSKTKKTIRYAIDKPVINAKKIDGSITLCFVGVIVERQGIDTLLSVIAKDNALRLRLIGSGEDHLIRKYQQLIESKGIGERVYFPNKFLYGEELYKEISASHIGVALYEEEKDSVTYYASPAKVYQFLEYGLPVILTGAAEVADLVKDSGAGIVVKRNEKDVLNAIYQIKRRYSQYLHGIYNFYSDYNYRTYYKDRFKFLEK